MAGDLGLWSILKTTGSRFHFDVEYVNGYWIRVSASRPSTTISKAHIEVATDPRGTWTEVHSYEYGYDVTIVPGVTFDGTTYRIIMWGFDTAGGSLYFTECHATDPTGTWTDSTPTVPFSNSTTDVTSFSLLDSGDYVLTAWTNDKYFRYFYATDPTGTWTKVEETDGTGGAFVAKFVSSIVQVGSTFYQHRADANSSTSDIYSATDIDGPWSSTSTSFSEMPTGSRFGNPDREEGLRVLNDGRYAWLSETSLYVCSDALPTGTWTQVAWTGLGSFRLFRFAYDRKVWVMLGGDTNAADRKPLIGYTIGGATPVAADLQTATISFTGNMDQMVGLAMHDGEFIGVVNRITSTSSTGLTGYVIGITGGPYVFPSGPSLLRQRQSPKRTPSRIRGTDLRARQTPFIN